MILNQVSQNKARNFGAGIYVDQSPGDVLIAKNWIYENTFGDPTVLPAIAAPTGGGVHAERSLVQLCQNQIYDNVARQGAGVYYGFGATGTGKIYLEENDIHGNDCSWVSSSPPMPLTTHGFHGAGVCVDLSPSSGGPFASLGRAVGFLRNKVHGNSALATQPVSIQAGDHQVGGGVYISIGLMTSVGPAPSVLDENFFIGNSIYDNEANLVAGGVFLQCVTDPVTPLVFENNTIDGNAVVSTASNGVPGLFLGCLGYVQWRATNNVISNNTGPGSQVAEWRACCSGTGPVTTPMQFTHALNEHPTGCPASIDLYGGGAMNNIASPLIVYPPIPDDSPHLGAGSTAVNTGQSPAPGWTSMFPFQVDIDGEPRILSTVVDRGADEQNLGDFKRGDANLDAVVNLADAVYILCVLFPPATPCLPFPCQDAADVTDSNGLNIGDVVYLLAYLFGVPPGPPPPAPGPFTCGVDPTADALDCVSAGVGCP